MTWTRPEQRVNRRREDMIFPDKTRTCMDCGETKPWTEFPPKGCDANGLVIRVLPRCDPCNVAERARQREQAKGQEPEVFLDPAPLRQFLLDNIAQRGEPTHALKPNEIPHVMALELESGVPARRIYGVLRAEFQSVSMDVADRLITGLGGVFAMVYPYDGGADDQEMTEAERLALLTKRCNRCREVKSWTEFATRVRFEDGTVRRVEGHCKACERKRRLAQYHRNVEVEKERTRQYRAAHPERVKATQTRYRQENRQAILAANRRRYQETAEERRAYARQYREKHREEVREKARLYREQNRELILQRKRDYRARKKAERLAAEQAKVIALPVTEQQPELELAA